ncbi:hypothetical protein HD554DRAFT_1236885 [Boletus coccyginus]|nr:hypothetical protein HD554DRAFT_1236885 [Boletus coccyginus]
MSLAFINSVVCCCLVCDLPCTHRSFLVASNYSSSSLFCCLLQARSWRHEVGNVDRRLGGQNVSVDLRWKLEGIHVTSDADGHSISTYTQCAPQRSPAPRSAPSLFVSKRFAQHQGNWSKIAGKRHGTDKPVHSKSCARFPVGPTKRRTSKNLTRPSSMITPTILPGPRRAHVTVRRAV